LIHEHGYRPNTAARALAGKHSHIIGLAIQQPYNHIATDPYFALLVQVLARACDERDYYFMLSPTLPQRPESYTRIIRGGHLDGLLVYYSRVDDSFIRHLEQEAVPFVLLGRHLTRADVPSVDSDNRLGARLVAEHLVGLGYRRIGAITGPTQAVSALDRRDAFLSVLAAAGLACPPGFVAEGDFTELSAQRCMERLLALSPRPEAVFAANDTMAVGAIRAARTAGLRVPDDVAVVGFDDMPFAALLEPPLTTVRQSAEQMGATAVAMLLDLVNQAGDAAVGWPRAQVMLPIELVVRASCGAQSRSAGVSRAEASEPAALKAQGGDA
jgi:LacI family transcriptional regulator